MLNSNSAGDGIGRFVLVSTFENKISNIGISMVILTNPNIVDKMENRRKGIAKADIGLAKLNNLMNVLTYKIFSEI